MDQSSLLPSNATPFELVFEQTTNPINPLDETIWSLHGLKILNPPASFLPYLIWEYGLGELQPYVPNLYDLIREGISWQRVRGTPLAISKALGWLGYAAVLEEEPTRRFFWNAFQLELSRFRDSEADLPRIEGVATVSVPLRSDFWRGYHGYDVREFEWGESRWGDASWDDDSGVRLPGGKAKWSFGRRFDYTHEVSPEDLAALGIPDAWAVTLDGEPLTLGDEPLRFVPPGGALTWGDISWLDLPWASDEVLAASAEALSASGAGPAWAVFKDADGDVLFYRRCRIRRQVVSSPSGVYAVGGERFNPAMSAATLLYLEAMTDFGDGYGLTAASVGFVLSASPASGMKPGLQYLPPGGLTPAGPIIAERPVSIEFGRTVRERVACLLRF